MVPSIAAASPLGSSNDPHSVRKVPGRATKLENLGPEGFPPFRSRLVGSFGPNLPLHQPPSRSDLRFSIRNSTTYHEPFAFTQPSAPDPLPTFDMSDQVQPQAGASASTKAGSTLDNTAKHTNISGVRKITPWEKKMEARKKQEAVKAREKEMKDAKIAEAERKRNTTRERKQKAEEKARLEAMASKMSAKKLARKKRRLGITKKVAHNN
ncbi:hypothetical protein ACQY0O_005257 [Thecaphora frezii]